MTYTNLRKHIATMAQIHELSENGQDQLAKFLGHDIRVHREIYRKPLDLIQKTKISKMLVLINEGKDVTEMSFDRDEEIGKADISGQCTEDSDDDDDEFQESRLGSSVVGENLSLIRNPRKRKACDEEPSSNPKRQIKRKPWAPSEMKSIKRHFGHFISMLKVPGKDDITKIQKKDKNLANRKWRNVKDQVYNLIKKQKLG